MHYFFNSDKKEEKKINNDFSNSLKLALKQQFCQVCNKAPATKIAFVHDLKSQFTCNNCQLASVGGQLKNLGDKSLISNDKLADCITKSLMNYQAAQVQPPQQIKTIENQGKLLQKSSLEILQKIKGEFTLLKSTAENKLGEILKQSQQNNTVYVFDELSRCCSAKKPPLQEIAGLISKKALVNKKGLHFIDEQNIEQTNAQIDEKFTSLKNESKIKLKQIDDLCDFINKIEL